MTTEGGKSGMVQYEHMNIQEGPEYTMKVEGFSTPFGLAVEDDLSENSETSFVVSGRCFEASEAPGWYNPSETDCGKVNFFGAKMSWASLGRLSSIIMEIKPVQKRESKLASHYIPIYAILTPPAFFHPNCKVSEKLQKLKASFHSKLWWFRSVMLFSHKIAPCVMSSFGKHQKT